MMIKVDTMRTETRARADARATLPLDLLLGLIGGRRAR
jgi:hypothetical protein